MLQTKFALIMERMQDTRRRLGFLDEDKSATLQTLSYDFFIKILKTQ